MYTGTRLVPDRLGECEADLIQQPIIPVILSETFAARRGIEICLDEPAQLRRDIEGEEAMQLRLLLSAINTTREDNDGWLARFPPLAAQTLGDSGAHVLVSSPDLLIAPFPSPPDTIILHRKRTVPCG